MAGTLVITTLSDGTNSTSATNCIQGSAKAWVNFNGTGTVAIRASYNVSSITDNGTGDYTVNFTNALPDSNYAVQVMGNVDASGNFGFSFAAPYNQVPTTTTIRLAVSNPSTRVDAAFVSVSIFD